MIKQDAAFPSGGGVFLCVERREEGLCQSAAASAPGCSSSGVIFAEFLRLAATVRGYDRLLRGIEMGCRKQGLITFINAEFTACSFQNL
jgi:hypothetical protein